MFSADDLLDILRRRRTLKSIRPEEPGRLPPAWERWLAAMPARAGGVSGAPAEAFVGEFAARPLRQPPRSGPPLTRWQAFGTLWRQQWEPARRDERGLRIFGMSASLVLHIGFAVILAWLMYLHLLLLLQVPEAPPGDGHVVQVEYLGTGAPETAGGGEQPPVREVDEPAPAATAVDAPEPARSASTVVAPDATAPEPALPELPVDVATPDVAAAVPPVPERDVPEPVPAQAAQPLQVTEVVEPDIDFVLPPPTPRVDRVAPRELAIPTRDVPQPQVVEAIEADLPTGLPAIAVAAPDAAEPRLAVPERAVPAPAIAAAVPVLAPEGPPAESAPAQAAASTAQDSRPAEATGQAAQAGASEPERADGAPATTGAGPGSVAAPGGWPSPVRGDDWDDALRDRSGERAGPPGLLDATGRPNLAGTGTGEGGPPGGAAPGSQAREAIDLERGGTWLRRPPLDHRPTRFDRIWIPTGTLLEEWVRRGIKQMTIPIPGSSKEIVCVVSILQLGGGCGITDPDLRDNPSSGRAAPDVPFKPELQEDQDSLARPPGG